MTASEWPPLSYAVPAWADIDAITDAALAVMRRASSDPDRGAISEYAEAAAMLVDDYLDRADSPFTEPPAPVFSATIQVTVELYRRKDAPFGVLNNWSDSDIGPVRVPVDWSKGVEYLLDPYAHRFGVG